MRTFWVTIGITGVLWSCFSSPDLLDQFLQGRPVPLVRERVRDSLSFPPPGQPLPPVLQRLDWRVQEALPRLRAQMEQETGLKLRESSPQKIWAYLDSHGFLLRYFVPANHPLYAGVALSFVVEARSGRIREIHLYPVPLE